MPKVEDVMTRGVISIDENANIEEAMRMMLERHVTSLVVRKKDDSDVFGIVTRKDIIHGVIGRHNDPVKVKVAEVMTKPVMTVTKQMDVVDVAKLMEKTHVRRFPVVENEKLVGLVSNSDIFKAYALDYFASKNSSARKK